MKFSIVLSFVVLCCVYTFTEAALAREKCPEKSTVESCLEHAKTQSAKLNYCHSFSSNSKTIEWQSCGTVACGGNAKVVEEDLSKPYPECCKRCEVIDSSKPTSFSAVL